MPKKRKSTEDADNDEQANENSASISQNEDNAKRVKLDLLTDTTLQDLPVEILELILIESVVMEVKSLKLVKSAWKDKVRPVISRLKQVSLQWSNILSTDYFKAELHRTLDDTDPDPIRLEVLEEKLLTTGIRALTFLNDEIFTVRKVRDQYFAIDVYDRDNMEVVKDVIKLPKSHVKCMAAGKASNCLYVGLLADQLPYTNLSVLRIRRDAQDQFVQSTWQHKFGRSVFMLSVSANGCLLTFTMGGWSNPASVAVHNADDSLQLEVFLPRHLGDFRHMNLMQRPNGNLVLSFIEDLKRRPNIMEIATTGNIVRQYESQSLGPFSRVNFADNYGRIIMTDSDYSQQMELLDPEFNLLGVYGMHQDEDKNYWVYIYDLKYDDERNVVMRSHYEWKYKRNVLTTFHFIDD